MPNEINCRVDLRPTTVVVGRGPSRNAPSFISFCIEKHTLRAASGVTLNLDRHFASSGIKHRDTLSAFALPFSSAQFRCYLPRGESIHQTDVNGMGT